ncbi:MAG: cupredoxin domain-containing protein [Acidobacteria bacterium]|nr:cupredoxin domain-containing protein [Acidobacteriota bacterium]
MVLMRGRCLVGFLTAGALLLGVDAGADGERRIVRMLAERFSFTPSEIRVARGTTLELRIRSDDTMHGFRIVGRNVNLMVPKRRQGEAVVVFEATEVGRYEFECSRLCGAGHNFMRGAIVVEDAAEGR